jgi:hypothetical protein
MVKICLDGDEEQIYKSCSKRLVKSDLLFTKIRTILVQICLYGRANWRICESKRYFHKMDGMDSWLKGLDVFYQILRKNGRTLKS